MATGDNERNAKAVAAKLGIVEVRANMVPESTNALIVVLHTKGASVAIAGDGVNKAPALAAADVGIAMGTGADVAVESARITLVKATSTASSGRAPLPRRRSATSSRTCSSPSSTTRSSLRLRTVRLG